MLRRPTVLLLLLFLSLVTPPTDAQVTFEPPNMLLAFDESGHTSATVVPDFAVFDAFVLLQGDSADIEGFEFEILVPEGFTLLAIETDGVLTELNSEGTHVEVSLNSCMSPSGTTVLARAVLGYFLNPVAPSDQLICLRSPASTNMDVARPSLRYCGSLQPTCVTLKSQDVTILQPPVPPGCAVVNPNSYPCVLFGCDSYLFSTCGGEIVVPTHPSSWAAVKSRFDG
jgi:hypothetical protein